MSAIRKMRAAMCMLGGLTALCLTATAETYKDVVLADAPAYYWTFDESEGNATNYGADSGGILVPGTEGTRVASTATPAGLPLGLAAKGSFRNTLAGGTLLASGADFSKWAIEFWIRPVGTGKMYLLDSKSDAPSMFWDWAGVCPGGIDIYSAGHKLGPALELNKWCHIVVGFDGASTTTFYKNGAVVATVSGAGAAFSATGDQFGINGTAGGVWDGEHVLLDELAIYDLSAIGYGYAAKLASIAAHRGTVPITYKHMVLEDGPAYYWTFDESSGIATNYGAYGGGALVPGTNGTRVTSAVAPNGLSLGQAERGGFRSNLPGGTSLDGDYNFTAWAVEFWINPASAGRIYLMSSAVDAPSMFWDWPGICPGGIDIYSAGHKLGPALALNKWQHIVVGYDGASTTTFYKNGDLASTVTAAGGVFSVVNAGFSIGSYYEQYGGTHVTIDEFAIYDLGAVGAGYSAKLAKIAAHASPPAGTVICIF
ncbi:MAG: hypothetical protein PHR35_01805 [Kiritimatiellae bacterium]|nr:hypothetical protein [Kiritimatiellia bacterium]